MQALRGVWGIMESFRERGVGTPQDSGVFSKAPPCLRYPSPLGTGIPSRPHEGRRIGIGVWRLHVLDLFYHVKAHTPVHVPGIASDASNIPQNDTGNHLGLHGI